jgi:hypothetical protein
MSSGTDDHQFALFTKTIALQIEQKHPLSCALESPKAQEKVFQLIKSKYKSVTRGDELYMRFVNEVEPRINELHKLRSKLPFKSILNEVVNSFDKDDFVQVDKVINKCRLMSSFKVYADKLTNAGHERVVLNGEVAAKIIASDLKKQLVKSMLGNLQSWSDNNDTRKEEERVGLTGVNSERVKPVVGMFKRRMKKEEENEFEVWATSILHTRAPDSFISFNESQRQVIVQFGQLDSSRCLTISISLNTGQISIADNVEQSIKKKCLSVLSESQDLKSNFLDICELWNELYNH